MPGKKYICKCGELFELLELRTAEDLKCPRCAGRNIGETNACSLEIGPPPWKYECQQCGIRFSVEAPRGPDETKKLVCPVCGSRNIKWLAYISEACPTGG